MAFFTGSVYSKYMLQDVSLYVILPQDGRRYIWTEPPKTLILLHGLSDNASMWVRKTAIERYAERYNLAVIMPEVQRSWYQDMVYGAKAFSFITKEVPELASKLFHLSTAREDMLIAGLSMGGYGALRCALEASDRFGYCGAFSGAYDLDDVFRTSTTPGGDSVVDGLETDFGAIFGASRTVPKEVKIENLLAEAGKKEHIPEVYMMCGTEDFLYEHSLRTKALCEKYLPKFSYEEWPGHHEWDMWDEAVERMLKRFLGEGRIDY